MEFDRLDIETPEHVRFAYELAGIGTRFLASLLDHVIQLALFMALLVVQAALMEAFPAFAKRGLVVTVVLLAGSTFIFLGYYIIFELIWNGQTPGKRQAGLRVIRDDGTPVGLTEVLLRNLLRLVDALPIYYGVGIVSILLSKQNKRVGDFVAGTVVVKERVGLEPETEPVAGKNRPEVELLAPLVARLSDQEVQAVERFIERRAEVEAGPRRALAARIAGAVRRSLGPIPAGTPTDNEAFLEAVYLALVRRRQRL